MTSTARKVVHPEGFIRVIQSKMTPSTYKKHQQAIKRLLEEYWFHPDDAPLDTEVLMAYYETPRGRRTPKLVTAKYYRWETVEEEPKAIPYPIKWMPVLTAPRVP